MKYVPYKSKKFKLKKEATEYIRDEKKRVSGASTLKVETNYNAGEPLPYEAVILRKVD